MGHYLASTLENVSRTPRRFGIWIFVLYLLLALAMSFPLAMHLTTHLPFGGDAFQTIWDFYWVHKVVTEGGDILHTNLMFAPDGVSLALHDITWLNSIPSVPLQMILGNRILAFNILWILSLSLSGYFMYLYARRHLGDGIPAFAAGCMFAFSTYHLHHGAQLGSMWIGWLPLFQLYIEDAFDGRGRIKDTGKAAIVLALAGYSHWYIAAFCLFQLFFTLIWKLITARPFDAAPIFKSLAIGVFGAILLLPILLPAAIESSQVENEYLKIQQREYYGADIAAMFIPSPRHPLFGRAVGPAMGLVTGNITEAPVYPGWILWILFIVAMFSRGPGWPRTLFLALCFLILSLGTKPHFLGHAIGLPLPYAAFEHIPGLDFIRVPARFMAPAMLFLSLGAGAGLSHVISRIGKPGIARVVGIAVIILALFDTTILPLPTRDTTKHSGFYAELANMDDGIVLDYPVYTYQEYLFYQTLHHKPIVCGYGIYIPDEQARWLVSLNDEPWKAEPLGVKYVIFHKGFRNPSPGGTILINGVQYPPDIYFERVAGLKLIHEDDYIKVFQ